MKQIGGFIQSFPSHHGHFLSVNLWIGAYPTWNMVATNIHKQLGANSGWETHLFLKPSPKNLRPIPSNIVGSHEITIFAGFFHHTLAIWPGAAGDLSRRSTWVRNGRWGCGLGLNSWWWWKIPGPHLLAKFWLKWLGKCPILGLLDITFAWQL